MELTDWIGPAILMASAALTVICVVASLFMDGKRRFLDETEAYNELKDRWR